MSEDERLNKMLYEALHVGAEEQRRTVRGLARAMVESGIELHRIMVANNPELANDTAYLFKMSRKTNITSEEMYPN